MLQADEIMQVRVTPNVPVDLSKLSADSGGSQSPSFSRFHQWACGFPGLA
jgi:hypothetical protein